MRIPSGVTDQFIYFVAVDATDLKTRETGLSSFTVYRSRNGAAAAAFTTPTINETDATNMPGVYELLLDEDMTIGSGNDSEEMVFHITHAGMAPVTRTIELYRPKITAGNTLNVASDGDVGGNVDGNVVGSVASVTGNVGGNVTGTIGGMTAAALADFFDTDSGTTYGAAVAGSVVAEIADNAGGSALTEAGIADAVWDEDIVAAHATSDTAGLLLSQLTGRSVTFSTAVAAGSVVDQLADDGTASFDRTTDSLQAIRDGAATVADIADGVWEEAQADHASAGTFGETATEIAAILVDTGTTLDGKIDTIDGNVDSILTDTGTTLPGTLSTIDGKADSILTDTGTTLPATLGTPAGADMSADIAAIKTVADAVLVDTGTTIPGTITALQADLPGRPTKNVALSDFAVLMVDATDGFTPETGLTVTGTISQDGGAFGALTNSVSEVASGIYVVDLTAAEMNADQVTLLFTASGAANRLVTIYTQPS